MHPDIERIESYRARLGLPHKELCQRSGVRPLTWWRLRKGLQKPRAKTVERLDKAVDEAAEARRLADPARPDELVEIMDLYKVAHGIFVEALGGAGIFRLERFTPEQITADDRRLGRQARAGAVYLLNAELGKRPGTIARAIGWSRSSAHHAIARVADIYDPRWLEGLGRKLHRAARRPQQQ